MTVTGAAGGRGSPSAAGESCAVAPGRVEILGNHTDYNQGVVLLSTIDLFTTVRGRRTDTGEADIRAADLGKRAVFPVRRPGLPAPAEKRAPDWSDYPRGVISALAARGIVPGGFEAVISSTIPPGAGLSSSAALELSFCLFLQGLFGFALERREAVLLCREAENRHVGVACGVLDQFACAFGRRNALVFLDCRDLGAEALPLDEGLSLLLCDAGRRRELGASAYNDRRDECRLAASLLAGGRPGASLRDFSSDAVSERETRTVPGRRRRALRRARHVTGEIERVYAARQCLGRGDYAGLGRLMYDSHESSRLLFENSTPELDRLVAAARVMPGVLGARLSGAGWGGVVVALVEGARAPEIAAGFRERFCPVFGEVFRVYRCAIPDGAALCP